MSTRAAVLLLYACGLAAAAGLGKVAALAPLVRGDLGLGLTGAAWLTSLIEAGGASLGLVAGLVVGRVGVRRPLAGGLLLLALAAFGEGLATTATGLYGLRLLESLGYLAVVVAAPTWIAGLTSGASRGAALSLWSTFVPVGMALGAGLAGLSADLLGWRGVVAAGGLAAVALLAASPRLPLPSATPRPSAGEPGAGPAMWLAAAGFGAYTTLQVGLLALLPSYFVDARGLDPASAGGVAALASLANVPGGLAAAIAVIRLPPLAIVLAALAVSVPLLPAIYAGGVDPVVAAMAAIVVNVPLGLVPAVVFARMPALSNGATAFGNGLLAQFGASGSLVGPPMVAAVVGAWGWPAAGASLVGLAALCAGLLTGAERLHRRRMRAG